MDIVQFMEAVFKLAVLPHFRLFTFLWTFTSLHLQMFTLLMTLLHALPRSEELLQRSGWRLRARAAKWKRGKTKVDRLRDSLGLSLRSVSSQTYIGM